MTAIISINQVNKTYRGGFTALDQINLTVNRGEIFALLGPNGAGKTTLISIICGIVNLSEGAVQVEGFDIKKNYREARSRIGLVPQELTTDAFETVWNTIVFSRGLFGKSPNSAYLEDILKKLSLWDKRDNKVMTLSGGMKRRLMIAKALSHEPSILFLDEPTAGVDVQLRKSMWELVRSLRSAGVTIILTTHYIEEAEEMADRIGIINGGKLIKVDTKANLMQQLGSKQLLLELENPLSVIPDALSNYNLKLSAGGNQLIYSYDAHQMENGIAPLLDQLANAQIKYKDFVTKQSSLEDIFVQLVKKDELPSH